MFSLMNDVCDSDTVIATEVSQLVNVRQFVRHRLCHLLCSFLSQLGLECSCAVCGHCGQRVVTALLTMPFVGHGKVMGCDNAQFIAKSVFRLRHFFAGDMLASSLILISSVWMYIFYPTCRRNSLTDLNEICPAGLPSL